MSRESDKALLDEFREWSFSNSRRLDCCREHFNKSVDRFLTSRDPALCSHGFVAGQCAECNGKSSPGAER